MVTEHPRSGQRRSALRAQPGSSVRRVSGWCDRPGCSAIASVAFTFDGLERTVWLDDVGVSSGTVAGHLCTRHADSMRPPRGWTVLERRTDHETASPDATPPPSPAPAVSATSGAAPATTGSWSPTGTPGSDLAAVLDARTPLLSRAFRSARDH